MVNEHQMCKFVHLNNDLYSPGDGSQTPIICGSNIMHVHRLHRYNIMRNITKISIEATSRIGKPLVVTLEISLILHNLMHYSITIITIIYYSHHEAMIQLFQGYDNVLLIIINEEIDHMNCNSAPQQ